MLNGGCACRAVRYRLEGRPYDTGWCHCRICRHLSGAGGMVFTTVRLTDFHIESGELNLARFPSTPTGERTFCMKCGTPITIHVQHQPGEIDIVAGSLDDPNAVSPAFHLFMDEAPAWSRIADGLPAYPALRPDTRGLPAGQTQL